MRLRCIPHQAIVAVFLFWLGGCTMLGPDFQTPQAQVPEKWSEQENDLFCKPSKDESIGWWTLFNDPVLDELIRIAYQQNLSLRSAGLRIIEARAQLGLVKGNLYPQVQEMQGDLFTIGATGPAADRYYYAASVGFDAAWEMDFWGKFRRSIESTDAGLPHHQNLHNKNGPVLLWLVLLLPLPLLSFFFPLTWAHMHLP